MARPGGYEGIKENRMNEDELKVLIEAALDFEKSLNNITGQMSQLTDRLKTYQIKVTAGLDKTSSRQKINDDLKSLKTTGPKVVGQLDKKATKKQVNDAVKQLQTTQIKLKGVMDETALKQQLSKVKADADINVTGSEQVKELREDMDKAGDSANAMAAKLYLARTALQALRKAAHEAIETVAELDKAATTLAIVTGGRSGEAYDLIAQYNELAKQLGATTVQISDAATSWLRQGKTTAETAELIEQSMILSKVAMVDSATATKNLTSAMRGYGMEVKDVASIVDKLSALDSKAAVTASDLAVAMSQTASSAKIGGVSMDRLLGYLTAVQEVTQRSPETIGQAFKTIFARMGNIKLGNFLSDDGEDLSDVETILKHYGIALRDLNGDFKAVTTTLDNLFPVWEEFKTIDKRAIAQAFAGTRQQENFLVLMENYGKAIEYAGVAAESAGNSMEKFAAYEESIEAKANAFTAALEGLTLDTVDSGFVGDLIDAGTAVVEFIDKTELLKATLLGLGAGATLKAVSALSGEFHTAKQTVLSLGEAMQTLRNVDNIEALSGETISRLGVLTKGLNDEQLRLVLSSQQLSTAQMQAILTAGGMSQAEATAKLQTMGLATAEGTATTATVGFSGAMMGLGTAIKAAFATNPIGMLMLSVGVIYEVITGVTALHDALTVTSEEAYESAEEMRSSYEEVEKEIEDLNGELQTSKTRISELQKLSDNGTITLVEQEELERLKRSNAELETTLARKKEIAALDAAEANKEYVNSYNKTTQGSNQQDVLLAESDAIWKANKDLLNRYQEYLAFPTDGVISDEELQRASELSNRLEEINQAISSGFYQGELLNEELSISEAVEQRVNTYNELAQLQESGVELSQAQKDLLESSRADLRNMAEKLDTDFLQKYMGEDANTEEWQRLLDLINKTIYATEYYNEKLNELPRSCYQTMERLGKEAGLSAEKVNELANQYPELAKWMSDSGKTAEDVAAHFNALSVAEEDVGDQTGKTATALTTAITKLEALSGNVDTISKALGEFADDGIVSIDTLNGMSDELKNLSTFEEFANILSNSAFSMDDVQEACNRLAEEYINTSNILDGVNEETAQVIEGHLSEMGVINAHEIVQARLNAVKLEALLASQNLTDAEWDSVEVQNTLTGSTEATIIALQQLRTAEYNAELANTDFSKASQTTIEDLLTQAKAAGVATEYINALSKALAFKKRFEEGKANSYELNHYEEILEGYKKQAEANIADINIVVPRIQVTRPKSGSGSKSKKEVEEYLATIDRFREAQEQLRRAEEKREKIESSLENSGSLEERIRLRKELIQAYKDEQAALHNLNEQRDAAIKEDVSKLTQRGFEIEYDPDNNQFWVKNLERINSLTAKSKGKYDTLQEATNAYRKETEELIKTLEEWNEKNRDGSNQWVEDELAKIAKIIEGYEDITKAYENEIAIRDKWVSNAAEKKDTAALEQSTREIVGYYQQMQQNIHEEANYYRSRGYSEDSDEVTALKTLWWDYAESIKDAKNNVIDYLTGLVEASNDAVDEIQGVYDTFHKAADEYAQSGGYITVDTFQEILALGPQYLQLLTDENGALVMEEEAIQNIIAARVEQLALENAMTYVERLRLAANGDSLESLNDLLYVTEENTDATWGFVKAKLALMKAKGELNTEQYEAALHNIEAMRVGAVNAIEGITKSVEGAGDLMKYVMDMMKSHVEQEIEGIERMKDEFAELIDLRKQALDAAKDEADYQKDIAAKTKEMAKLQARIDALSLDDSREAQAERAKLLEEMNGLQEDLNEKQADHAIDQQKEALDKMQKDYEETQDARIKDLEDSISSEQKLYDMAVNHIKSNWGFLLDELTNWNYQFGSDLTTEIESAWDKAIQAAQNYFSYVSGNDVTGKDYVKYYESTNQGGSGGSGSGGSNKNYTVADTKKTQDYSDLDMVHAIVARMKEYAAAWKPGDPTGEHSKAATEAARLPQYGVEAEFRNGSGIWEIEEDKFNPKNKGKNLYSVYHTGGIVGGGEIKANEKFALLKDKEWVLSEEMVDNLSKQMERINTLSKAFEGMTPQAISPAQVLPEIVRVDGGSSIQNITHNRPVEVNLNGDTIIQGADKTTVEKHKKITRDQVNEIAKMLRIR